MTVFGLIKIKDEIINEAFNLKSFSFMTQGMRKKAIRLAAKGIAESMGMDKSLYVNPFELEKVEYKFISKVFGDARYACLVEDSYDINVACALLKEASDDPDFPSLVKKYENSSELSLLNKAIKELSKTEKILVTNLSAALDRGEKLDQMIDKSEDICQSAKLMLKSSKKRKKCC